jgi:hypothetical protein
MFSLLSLLSRVIDFHHLGALSMFVYLWSLCMMCTSILDLVHTSHLRVFYFFQEGGLFNCLG